MKEGKPFFYRIDLIELMDFATEPEGETMSLLQFAKELKKGQSAFPAIQKIIDEAHNYIEKKKIAGSKGGQARISNAQAVLESTSSELKPEAVAEAVAETITVPKSKRKKRLTEEDKDHLKIVYASDVRMTEVEHANLVESYGTPFTAACIAKLSNHKGAKGVAYKSDYKAILSWVVEAVSKTFGGKNGLSIAGSAATAGRKTGNFEANEPGADWLGTGKSDRA